jgi:hypothetical protein
MSTADARMACFMMLTEEEQHQAIKRLAASGMADTSIAAATMLSIEQVRQILGARVVCEGCNDG